MEKLSVKMDGRFLADKLAERLKSKFTEIEITPRVAVVYAGSDPSIDNFIKIKKKKADFLGISMVDFRFPDSISANDLKQEIEIIQKTKKYDGSDFYQGLIVQLPLPKNLKKEEIVDCVDKSKDIDLLSLNGQDFFYNLGGLEPVPFAIMSLIKEYKINLFDKKIVLLGNGFLVGQPVFQYLKRLSLEPVILDKKTGLDKDIIKSADVIISGIGEPGIVKGEFLKDNVVLFDAGTSESGGVVVGDFDPGCYLRSSFYSPVPGGIGPLTVIGLFQNLYLGLLYKSESN